jgi:hypothetical protein
MHADVPARVQALLGPPPRPRPGAVAALAALVLTCTRAAGAVQHLGEQLFEHAGAPVHGAAGTRTYTDSGLCMFEVKLTGVRGETVKQRVPHPARSTAPSSPIRRWRTCAPR